MSSIEPNKYEEHRAVPSTSMDPGRWRPAWWTRRALLGTAAGAAFGAYGLALGLAAEVPSTFDGTGFQLRRPSPMPGAAGSYATGVSARQRTLMCISRARASSCKVACMTT